MAESFCSYEVGKAYLLFSVTHYFTGRIVAMTPTDFVLEDCAWIPQTGRLHDCLKNGTVEECEPLPDGFIVTRSTIVGGAPWKHALPKKVV